MAQAALIITPAMADRLDIIGDRWTLLILRDAFLGRRRFAEFLQHTGASRSILSQRLARLVDSDILYRRPYGDAGRSEYGLTATGMGLYGASLLAWQWEREWAGPAGLPASLRHTLCGHPLQPEAQCRYCRCTLLLDEVGWASAPQDSQFSAIRSASGQRQGRVEARGSDPALATVSALIGDRWTLLILIAAFFGFRRYDDFSRQLGIATNILTRRLGQLVEADVFTREPYQAAPLRYQYVLGAKGKSLYPLVMALRQWAAEGVGEAAQPGALVHVPCGHPLVVDVVCGHCGQKPWPQDVKI